MKPILAILAAGAFTMHFGATCRGDLVGEAPGDNYGRCVASLGDVDGDGLSDFAVAAPYHDQGGLVDCGKVYVYSGATQELLGTPLIGAHSGDLFGYSIAAGNLTGDERKEVIIGAPEEALGGFAKVGRISLFAFNSGQWQLLAQRAGGFAGERFGWSLASGVRLGTDAYDNTIVGAPFNSQVGSKAGRVVIYRFSATAFIQVRSILGQKAGDRFGYSVARIGKGNSDSQDEFVVGAPYNDEKGSNAGKTYVYSGAAVLTAGAISPLHVKKGKKAGDRFGLCVAGVGDVDGGGRHDYAVGAPNYDSPGGTNAGRVYVFSVTNAALLWSRTGSPGSLSGWAISGGLDFNADARAEVLIGAYGNDTPGSDAGAFQLISGVDGGECVPSMSGESAGDWLGHGLAMLKSIDGDAVPEILAGAPGFDAKTDANAGRVYLVLSPGLLQAGAQPGLAPPDLAGDVNGDGAVSTDDLLMVLSDWGSCAEGDCPADLDQDGAVDGMDLLAVIERLE